VFSKWNGRLEKKCVGGFSPFFVDGDFLVAWEFELPL
jgi:hypothetical protein